MASGQWASGSLVRIRNAEETLIVISHDSVGSVICQPIDDKQVRVHIAPLLLESAGQGFALVSDQGETSDLR